MDISNYLSLLTLTFTTISLTMIINVLLTDSEIKKHVRTLEQVIQSFDVSDKEFMQISRLCGALEGSLEATLNPVLEGDD